MTTNEKLVELYKSTDNIKLKEKIYKELYEQNKAAIKKFVERKIKTQNILYASKDLWQESKIAMYIAIDKYDNTKASFSTYFIWLMHSRFDYFMRVHVYPFIANDVHIDFAREDVDFSEYNVKSCEELEELASEQNPEIILDNYFICDHINYMISKLKFKKDWHELVFRYRYGLNAEKITVKERELAEIFNVTQQRIAFICKNYKDKLKIIVTEHINNGYNAEDLGLDSKVKRG